jgi:hypothetical protein
VNTDSCLTISHPADPDKIDNAITNTRVPSVAVDTRDIDLRQVNKVSSEVDDVLEPDFAEIHSQRQNVILGWAVSRPITDGSSRLDITKVYGKHEMKGPSHLAVLLVLFSVTYFDCFQRRLSE